MSIGILGAQPHCRLVGPFVSVPGTNVQTQLPLSGGTLFEDTGPFLAGDHLAFPRDGWYSGIATLEFNGTLVAGGGMLFNLQVTSSTPEDDEAVGEAAAVGAYGPMVAFGPRRFSAGDTLAFLVTNSSGGALPIAALVSVTRLGD